MFDKIIDYFVWNYKLWQLHRVAKKWAKKKKLVLGG